MSGDTVSKPKHQRNPGDPVRRAAAQAARAKADAERAAAEAAYWTATEDVRPEDLLSVDQCRSLHASALAAYTQAQDDLEQAAADVATAEAWDAEGRDLALLALNGNMAAMDRLRAQVRAVHPGIVGFLPAPDANDEPRWWRGDMKDLGLVVDVPTSAEVVTADYVAGLAEALRAFVRRFEPKIGSSNRRVGKQGHAYAETRVGRLLYHSHPKRSAYFQHANPADPISLASGSALAGPGVAEYATLEDALTALPAMLTVGALAGQANPYFRTFEG